VKKEEEGRTGTPKETPGRGGNRLFPPQQGDGQRTRLEILGAEHEERKKKTFVRSEGALERRWGAAKARPDPGHGT